MLGGVPLYRLDSREYRYIQLRNSITVVLQSEDCSALETPSAQEYFDRSYGSGLSARTYYTKYKDTKITEAAYINRIKSVSFRIAPDAEYACVWRIDGEPVCWCSCRATASEEEKYLYYDFSLERYVEKSRTISVPESFELSGYGSCNSVTDRKLDSGSGTSVLYIYGGVKGSYSDGEELLRIPAVFTGRQMVSEKRDVEVWADDEYTRRGYSNKVGARYSYTRKYLDGEPAASFTAVLPL